MSCSPGDDKLDCHAILSSEGESARDMTDAVAWSTSDNSVATVYRGQVAAVGPGMASITASALATPGRQSSTVVVLVSRGTAAPEVAYSINGEVRDFATQDGAADVQVTLRESAQTGLLETRLKTITKPDGSFSLFPVLAGRYHIRATSSKFRSTEKEVMVPDSESVTLVLLPEAGSGDR